MLTTFQTKIDYLIIQGYQNMIPESQNELVSLIQYTQAFDLFEFTAKSYHIQQTEILLNVSLCWEILGNSKQALEYLNKALAIVPNQPSLILYKSILLLSLNLLDESQRNLLRYKQLGGCSHSYIFYYDTFRILFYYVLKYEDDVILSEINEYIAKYTNETHNALANNSFAAFYYIRSVLFSNCALKQKREETKHLLIKKYEENISKAYKYHHNDTCFYIQEGINRDNLSKAFMMIFPYITQSKPKMLVNYKHMVQGLKLFYVLFKAVKLFKIKLKRKKIKMYYIQQLKFSKQTTHVKEKDHSVESKEENIKSTKNINTCNESVKTKSNKKKGKNDSSGDDTDRNSNANQSKKIDEIKKEFLDEIRNLYKSVWVYNYALLPKQKSNNEKSIVAPVHFNYFIRNGYYSSSNLKENIIKGITYNEDYKLKLNQQQEKRGVQLLKVNNNDRSNNKINSGNNNSNAKTESSAPSQISTYSNAKTGDNEETVKKIHQYNSTKEIKQIQSSIPLQLNYQTEMKSHSNERINYYNNNNSQFNLIDVSDYNETNDKLIPDTKNDMIIKKNTPNKPIELCSNYKQIVNSNKSLSNNQPSSSLLLKKNIPQAKTRSDLLHLVSKKNNYKHCNVSIEKFIKFSKLYSIDISFFYRKYSKRT